MVYPDYRQVKARKVTHATRRLGERYAAYCDGEVSLPEFDASVQGWINHVRFADSWGLRRHMLAPFQLGLATRQRLSSGFKRLDSG